VKILVIGDGRDTTRACNGMRTAGEVGDDSTAVVRFDDSQAALRELERGVESYAWVLVENAGDALATADAVRSCRPSLPVAVFSSIGSASAGRRTPPALCAVETTCDGARLLRCALHRASMQPDGQRALHEAIDTHPLVFEYHAPCHKVR